MPRTDACPCRHTRIEAMQPWTALPQAARARAGGRRAAHELESYRARLEAAGRAACRRSVDSAGAIRPASDGDGSHGAARAGSRAPAQCAHRPPRCRSLFPHQSRRRAVFLPLASREALQQYTAPARGRCTGTRPAAGSRPRVAFDAALPQIHLVQEPALRLPVARHSASFSRATVRTLERRPRGPALNRRP